jgi:hypothetical protein
MGGRRALREAGCALRDVQVSRVNQQIACALLPGTHQLRAAGDFGKSRRENYFQFVFNHLVQPGTSWLLAGTALAL